ncbi:hypothetical protein B0H17DRAFT_1184970 [Mycena rosella]|uniref:Uncharacterized protein n=1 Tax=Mycena rosella TaxID=1033263 RepID=A0AAD7G5Z2_MYCRO|nr:hypothetical protein B0H17DRAFT_1184970 [Mycena rosella]
MTKAGAFICSPDVVDTVGPWPRALKNPHMLQWTPRLINILLFVLLPHRVDIPIGVERGRQSLGNALIRMNPSSASMSKMSFIASTKHSPALWGWANLVVLRSSEGCTTWIYRTVPGVVPRLGNRQKSARDQSVIGTSDLRLSSAPKVGTEVPGPM